MAKNKEDMKNKKNAKNSKGKKPFNFKGKEKATPKEKC